MWESFLRVYALHGFQMYGYLNLFNERFLRIILLDWHLSDLHLGILVPPLFSDIPVVLLVGVDFGVFVYGQFSSEYTVFALGSLGGLPGSEPLPFIIEGSGIAWDF